MKILAEDIQSQDGVANAAIAEAAMRLEEQNQLLIDMQDIFSLSRNWTYQRYFDDRVKFLIE